MIVNYTEKGWQIITQRAHGLLAAQIAFHWKAEDRPKRWLETLIAIAEHDDATNELQDCDLINENGGPVNFKMKDFELEHCEKLISQALTKSKYIASLTARHIYFLYEKPENRAAYGYCQQLREAEKGWLDELEISEQEISRTYHLMEWCDAFSLLICQQLIQPEKRGIEISIDPNFTRNQLYELATGELTVEPWPFEGERFEVEFESKIVNQLVFENSEAFRNYYKKAQTQFNKYTIAKS